MFHVHLVPVEHRLSFFSDFVQEEWTGVNPPTEAEALTLLCHGNPGRKSFVAWFMEKVIFHTPLLNTYFNIY